MLAYHDPAFGHDVRRYDLKGVAPTSLHGVGNAFSACPCGCRSQGLSLSRLRQGGSRGQGVVSASTGKVRFAHPQELGLLNAIPPKYSYVAPPRAALCLIGQVASPLQAFWVVSQVQVWLDSQASTVLRLSLCKPWKATSACCYSRGLTPGSRQTCLATALSLLS